jgi:phosphotransferase system enzyme I (PtsI)
VTLEPDNATLAEFEVLIKRQRELTRAACGGPPAGTFKAGGEVLIYANIHPGVPMDGLLASGARGVGLYRSEDLWLNRGLEPTEEEQFNAYREVAELMGTFPEGACATIRVLDIGGDKIMRGISTKELNPFLGNRSIRYLLSNEDVMRKQLRAILRASAFGKLQIMYPMVSCIEELDESAKILSQVKAELDGEGIAYDRKIKVGVMIEVPSAAINAEAFARRVDFFSIGTNDLVQYVMAADRGNDAVAHLYQPANPAILKLIANVVAAAKQCGIEVGVCGASAADPVLGVLWVAMGVDVLSMSASYIRAIAKIFSSLTSDDLAQYAKYAAALTADQTSKEVYEACRKWLGSKVSDFESFMV